MAAQSGDVRLVFSFGSQKVPGWEGVLESLVVLTIIGLIWHFTGAFAVLGVIAAVVVHELGHLFTARLSDITILEIWISPCGVSIDYSAVGVSDLNELLVVIAGSAVSFAATVGFLIAYFVTGESHTLLVLWAAAFAIIGIVLPLQGDDGARAWQKWTAIQNS